MNVSPEYESGNTMKSLLGFSGASWDSSHLQGAFAGLSAFDPNNPTGERKENARESLNRAPASAAPMPPRAPSAYETTTMAMGAHLAVARSRTAAPSVSIPAPPAPAPRSVFSAAGAAVAHHGGSGSGGGVGNSSAGRSRGGGGASTALAGGSVAAALYGDESWRISETSNSRSRGPARLGGVSVASSAPGPTAVPTARDVPGLEAWRHQGTPSWWG